MQCGYVRVLCGNGVSQETIDIERNSQQIAYAESGSCLDVPGPDHADVVHRDNSEGPESD